MKQPYLSLFFVQKIKWECKMTVCSVIVCSAVIQAQSAPLLQPPSLRFFRFVTHWDWSSLCALTFTRNVLATSPQSLPLACPVCTPILSASAVLATEALPPCPTHLPTTRHRTSMSVAVSRSSWLYMQYTYITWYLVPTINQLLIIIEAPYIYKLLLTSNLKNGNVLLINTRVHQL